MRLIRDERGGVLVEATILLSIIFVFLLGLIDFLHAYYQWNSASKAVQIGARIAAVSDPVATGVTSFTGLGEGVEPGDPIPPESSYVFTCNGAALGAGCSADALNTIVYGRGGDLTCEPVPTGYLAGMCHMFWRVRPENVVISYAHTGLGYAGRPGGPIPTITVELQNLPFQFFFLGGLLGFGNIDIPSMRSTITGEDLSSSAP